MADKMPQDPVIGVPDGSILSCRCWDDECVIYNQASGNTHLFDQASAEIVLAVLERPMARSKLLAMLSESLNQLTDSEVERFFDEFLKKCRQSGLLEAREG